MIRFTVHFWGHVQGVGFRYTTRRVAGRFLVAGTVKNLLDGRVELVVEGDRKELLMLIQAVNEAMEGNIVEQKQDESIATGEFGEPRRSGVVIAY